VPGNRDQEGDLVHIHDVNAQADFTIK
jgi:hypothetical protein